MCQGDSQLIKFHVEFVSYINFNTKPSHTLWKEGIFLAAIDHLLFCRFVLTHWAPFMLKLFHLFRHFRIVLSFTIMFLKWTSANRICLIWVEQSFELKDSWHLKQGQIEANTINSNCLIENCNDFNAYYPFYCFEFLKIYSVAIFWQKCGCVSLKGLSSRSATTAARDDDDPPQPWPCFFRLWGVVRYPAKYWSRDLSVSGL